MHQQRTLLLFILMLFGGILASYADTYAAYVCRDPQYPCTNPTFIDHSNDGEACPTDTVNCDNAGSCGSTMIGYVDARDACGYDVPDGNPVPPEVYIQDVHSVDAESAIVSTDVAIDWDNPIYPDEVVVDYGTSSGNYPETAVQPEDWLGSDGEVHLIGLEANTTYFARARVEYEGGTNYSYETNFTTSETGAIITDPATNITEDGATLNATSENTWMEYGFVWGTESNVYTNYAIAGEYSDCYADEYTDFGSCLMTVLAPSTTYYVRAILHSGGEVETTIYGNEISFTTSAGLVQTNPVTNITATSATLHGTVNVDCTSGEPPAICNYSMGRTFQIAPQSDLENYQVCYTDNDNEFDPHPVPMEGGSFQCDISGLTMGETYIVRAYVSQWEYTSGGEGGEPGWQYIDYSQGGEVTFTAVNLDDIIIIDPDVTQMNEKVSEGYMSIATGAMDNARVVNTNVNVTFRTTSGDAIFPAGTRIQASDDGYFDFRNFTISNATGSIQDSIAAIDLGVPGVDMVFDQPITVMLQPGIDYNGREYEIYYQNEGDTNWTFHDMCTVTNGTCTFTTDHATIYTINGVHQSTGNAPMNINTNVQATLSMDCYDPTDSNTTVQLGTTTAPGTVTAGTPAVGTSRCDVTTNDDQGYYLMLTDTNATYTTLTHTDPNTSTIYEISDDTLNTYTGLSTTLQTWNAPTTKGLGFSVIHFPESNTSHNTFNTFWTETNQCPEGSDPDTNTYAAIPQTPQPIAAVTAYHANTTTTDLCYKVDVPASQPSGQYTGTITFTATSDASGYYQ